MSKVSSGLLITTIGLVLGLSPTLIYMSLAEQGVGRLVSTELAPQLPLYLALSIVSVPITLSGLVLFRRGIRERYQLGYAMLGGEGPVAPQANPSSAASPPKEIETPMNSDSPKTSMQTGPRSGVIIRVEGKTVICSSCGAEAEVGATSCPKCRASFPLSMDASRSCPVCRASMEKLNQVGGRIFICGLCFSELELPPEMAAYVLRLQS